MEIRGRVAVVTGAGSGIGQAAALQLANRGVKGIGLVDMSPAVHEVAAKINETSGKQIAQAFVGDTTKAEFRRSVYDQVISKLGVPGICVPAAGITRDALAVRVDKTTGKAAIYAEELFRQVVDVNLVAPVYWAIEMIARIAEDRHRRGLGKWQAEEDLQGTCIFIGSVSSQG